MNSILTGILVAMSPALKPMGAPTPDSEMLDPPKITTTVAVNGEEEAENEEEEGEEGEEEEEDEDSSDEGDDGDSMSGMFNFASFLF